MTPANTTTARMSVLIRDLRLLAVAGSGTPPDFRRGVMSRRHSGDTPP
jgi:hypothetical protein